jgi:hypothetical protein
MEIAKSVNWDGEDSRMMEDIPAEDQVIVYPFLMIQEEVYYQWPSMKPVQE